MAELFNYSQRFTDFTLIEKLRKDTELKRVRFFTKKCPSEG